MTLPRIQLRTFALLGLAVSLLGAFLWLALTSGPAAPIPVTVASVSARVITPALFGVGTVEARYTYRIGPTFAGRVSRVEVQVGERVRAGQMLGEMDPVDLDDRVAAQDAALRRAEGRGGRGPGPRRRGAQGLRAGPGTALRAAPARPYRE